MVARNSQEPGKPTPEPADADELLGGAAPVDESREALIERIKALEAENAKLGAAKDIAEEESARLSAQAQSSLLTSGVVERFAGKADDGDAIVLFWSLRAVRLKTTEVPVAPSSIVDSTTWICCMCPVFGKSLDRKWHMNDAPASR